MIWLQQLHRSFFQSIQWHPHVDSYYVSEKGCGHSLPGAIGEEGDDDFGAY